MKTVAVVAGAGLVILLLITGSYALALLLVLLGVGVGVVHAIRQSSKLRREPLPPEVRPFGQVRDAIRAIAESSSASPEARAIARDLAVDADALVEQALRFVQGSKGIRSISTTRQRAEEELKALMKQVEDSGNENDLALAHAKEAEIAHYRQSEAVFKEGWARLERALAALAELRAKLVSDTAPIGDETTALIERIKTLSKSYDESTETTEVNLT